MWAKPTQADLKAMPKIYAQEKTKSGDQIVYGHFFMGAHDWFITEFDGEDTFFGFAILNGDLDMAEWGYISFQELKDLKQSFMQVDFDKHWDKRPVREVDKIVKAGGVH